MTTEQPYKDTTTPVLWDHETGQIERWKQATLSDSLLTVEHLEASSLGRVRVRETKQLVEQYLDDDGYLYFLLENQGLEALFPVHVLIYYTFIDEIEARDATMH
ncbi:MAG: hypothetical protein ACR2OW_09215 [Methyloligellaceae bacterium]